MKSALLLLLALPVVAFSATKPKHPKKAGPDSDLPVKPGGLIQAAPSADMPAGLISTDLDGKDIQFLNGSVANGRLQAWLGKMAKDKAAGDQVRAVGDALASTQTEENDYLVKLAAKKGVPLEVVSASPPDQRKMSDQLKDLSGAEFDKEVLGQIVTVAEQSVQRFESALQSKDGDIRKVAEQLLPMAREKLLLANKMSGNATEEKKPVFRASAPAPLPAR